MVAGILVDVDGDATESGYLSSEFREARVILSFSFVSFRGHIEGL